MYGGSLTLISAVDSFKRVRPTLARAGRHHRRHRRCSRWSARWPRTENFLANFEQLPAAGALLLHPVDGGQPGRLLHRPRAATTRSRRSSSPTGIYGRWGWRGIVAYLVGFVAMVPFFSAGTLFTGPVAKAMHGADISLFIGLPVAGGLYWLLTRNIDVEAEQRLAEQQTGRARGGRP